MVTPNLCCVAREPCQLLTQNVIAKPYVVLIYNLPVLLQWMHLVKYCITVALICFIL